MVLIRLLRDEDGRPAGFDARGHALFAEEGSDIVCAGVSALLQTTLLGLERCADAHPTFKVAKGGMRCRIPRRHRQPLGAVLLESMLLGLREIENRYPGYIRVEEASTR